MEKCTPGEREHVKTCKKCVGYHENLNPATVFPLAFGISRRNLRNNCLAVAFEVIFLMKKLKSSILQDGRRICQENAQFLSSLQTFYLSLSGKLANESKNIEQILEVLTGNYTNVLIEDVFDAFSMIFHCIHNSNRHCSPVCPIHNVLELLVFEEITCECGYKTEISWGHSIYYHIALIKSSENPFFDQIHIVPHNCQKCRRKCNTKLKITTCPTYLIFKIIEGRTEEKSNFHRVITKSLKIHQVFSTNSQQNYDLLVIITKINSELQYLYLQNSKVYRNTGDFYSFDQVFKLFPKENTSVIGLIYEISETQQFSPNKSLKSPQKTLKYTEIPIKSPSISFKSIVKKCAHCGNPLNGPCKHCLAPKISKSIQTCSNCKTPIKTTAFCPICRNEILTEICGSCGTKPEKLLCQVCHVKKCKFCENFQESCTCPQKPQLNCAKCSQKLLKNQPFYCRTCISPMVTEACRKCKVVIPAANLICSNCMQEKTKKKAKIQ